MSAKIDSMLLLLIGFIAIIAVLNLEPTLLSIITVLVTIFTLQLMILYKKELFGGKKK